MVQLRNELKSKRFQEKFENSSTVLDTILKSQRNPSSKAGLGYEQKGNNGFSNIIKNHPKSYAEALLEKSMKKGERTRINRSSMQPSLSLKKEEDSNIRKISKASITPQKKSLQNTYPYIFHGYCFACLNYGDKSMMCKAYGRNPYRKNMFHSETTKQKFKIQGGTITTFLLYKTRTQNAINVTTLDINKATVGYWKSQRDLSSLGRKRSYGKEKHQQKKVLLP